MLGALGLTLQQPGRAMDHPVPCADSNRSFHRSASLSATSAARRSFPSAEYAA